MTRRCLLLAALIAIVALAFPPRAGAATQRLILEAEPGSFIRVEGLYPPRPDVCPSKQPRPLQAKYRDRVELRVGGGAVQIINTLSFSNYLRGLAEVPASWPPEALRAQAIAARSYAIAGMRNQAGSARTRGYDICASDQCQVYRGATVELGAFGERWVRAVESTKGRVMTYNGAPITAYYFSTSTGHTRRAFPGGSPSPWLRSVDAMDDDAPLARWTAPVPLRDLAAILRADGLWPGGAIRSVARSGDTVTVSGAAGTRRIAASEVRSAVNSEGPCLFPERYPNPKGSQSGGRMPLSVPSSTYELEAEGTRIVFRGRGWGHDVGMSQYGAKALAERGWASARILGHYYAHDRISTITEPDPIRVLAAEGLQKVRIAIEGRARIRTGTGSRLAPGDRFEVRLRDGDLRVLRGLGPSLKPVLEVTSTGTNLEASPGQPTVAIAFNATRSVRVQVSLRDAAGDEVVRTPETSFESGDHEAEVSLIDEAGAPLPAGEYSAIVIAYDGLDRIRTEPVAVLIAAPSPTPAASGPDAADGGAGNAPLIAAIAILAFASIGLLARLLASRR